MDFSMKDVSHSDDLGAWSALLSQLTKNLHSCTLKKTVAIEINTGKVFFQNRLYDHITFGVERTNVWFRCTFFQKKRPTQKIVNRIGNIP